MGVRRGGEGKGGALAPPPGRSRPAKNIMFLDFFGKNSNLVSLIDICHADNIWDGIQHFFENKHMGCKKR